MGHIGVLRKVSSAYREIPLTQPDKSCCQAGGGAEDKGQQKDKR